LTNFCQVVDTAVVPRAPRQWSGLAQGLRSQSIAVAQFLVQGVPAAATPSARGQSRGHCHRHGSECK